MSYCFLITVSYVFSLFNWLAFPPPTLSASAEVITETDTVELSCEYTEDRVKVEMEMCYFNINQGTYDSKPNPSCQLSITGSQISDGSDVQFLSVKITCFYTVKMQDNLVPSLFSDPVTVTVHSKLFFLNTYVEIIYRIKT